MIRILATLAVGWSLLACSKGTDGTSTTSTSATTGPASPKTAALTKAGAKVECDKVIPKATRDKYLSGMEQSPPLKAPPEGTTPCIFRGGGGVAMVTFVCPAWDEATFKANMEDNRKAMSDARNVGGVGRMAFVGTSRGVPILQFWDDDTNCSVAVAGVEDLEGLAKEIAAALTPATIQ